MPTRPIGKCRRFPERIWPIFTPRSCFNKAKKAEAVEELEKLAKAPTADHAARLRLVGAYVVMGWTDDALHYLAGLLQSNPKDTDALLLRSRVYLTPSQPSEAEKDLQAVLRIQPNSADAHYGLSECMACSDRKRIGSRS